MNATEIIDLWALEWTGTGWMVVVEVFNSDSEQYLGERGGVEV